MLVVVRQSRCSHGAAASLPVRRPQGGAAKAPKPPAFARRLRGGYAEWIEHSEPISVPMPPEGGKFAVGQQVERASGGRYWVQAAGPGPVYTLWNEDGSFVAGVREDELRS